MRYLLDTNTVSALMKGVPAVADRMTSVHRANVAISQVTVAEIEFGLRYLPHSDFDLSVAAHAIAHVLTVVTSDAAFARLGVRREDWVR